MTMGLETVITQAAPPQSSPRPPAGPGPPPTPHAPGSTALTARAQIRSERSARGTEPRARKTDEVI